MTEPRDFVDGVIDEWRRERPDLDLATIGVTGRLTRAFAFIEAAIEPTLDEFGLSRASFDTLAVLRRSGPPYQLTAGELATRLMRSAGTLTTRIDRLVDAGLVVREPDPRDRRVMLVALTDDGWRLTDDAASAHLANEARLLSPLAPRERQTLARLLRTLLIEWEAADSGFLEGEGCPIPRLGVRVMPAHVSLEMRRAVALPDRVGLLVRAVDLASAAEVAGIARGDLLVRVGAADLRTPTQLRAAVSQAGAGTVSLGVVRVNDDFDVAVGLDQSGEPEPAVGARLGTATTRA